MNLLNALTKKTTTAVLTSILLLSLFTSCKKENSNAVPVSEATAAEAISQSISGESGGMSEQSSDACNVTTTQVFLLPCGVQHDSTISGSITGPPISFSFNLSWNWILSCSNLGLPEKITFHLSGSSNYDGPSISSTGNSTGTFEISDLASLSAEYSMTANYTRQGTTQSKVLNENSFTSTITVISSDIKINKISRVISSGTAAVSITGTSFSGIAFSYTGTVTFLGDKKATLTMSSGMVYQIAW
ncbi:hypothetical protein BH11BAC6_BH11BAC6_16990 [soil metagenome]